MKVLHLILAVPVIAANVYWIRIKRIVRPHGPLLAYLSHLQDLGDFQKLIDKERNPVRREQYTRLQAKLYGSLAVSVLVILTMPFWSLLLGQPT